MPLDQSATGLRDSSQRHVACHTREAIEEIVQAVARFEVGEQRPHRDARARKDRLAGEDAGIDGHDRVARRTAQARQPIGPGGLRVKDGIGPSAGRLG